MFLRIAIPTDDGQVSAHFGRCSKYTLIDVEDGKEVGRKMIDCPPHEPGMMPKYLNEHGVNIIIAGGMGQRAQTLFQQLEIGVIGGVSGPIESVLQQYIEGNLRGGENPCQPGAGKGAGGGHHCHED